VTPDRWQEIQALFLAVADLDPAAQATYLDEACVADPTLRDEVMALLATERRSLDTSFIAGAVAAEARALAADTGAGRLGQRVGPYRLLRELGRGGMGTVYLAERVDEQYHASVAIKFVRSAFAAPELARRLRAERQILADLAHPNIAWLLDGGTAADGTPYLVMEYVDGEPIDAWCDHRGVGLAGRLALFRRVCSAVQYAHQALVVHRDLKPSNILVTADGTPKLVDFGIAKLMAGADAETTGTLRLMTPAYAAPEQARGGRITVATDVYALGGVLYRLLTGRTPIDVVGVTPGEVERRITETQPAPPSTAAQGEAGGWGRALRGDLDTIVLKALHKEPARRYASVEQLADDVRRHEERRPVLARPDRWGYRVARFVRRHRLSVAAATAVAGLLIAFGIVTSLQAARVARERDAAAAVSGFLVSLFGIVDPERSRGDSVTAREVLDSGVARVRTSLSGQPELQARMMAVMAETYSSLGLYPRAMELARDALRLRQERFGERHRSFAASLGQVAGLHYELGNLDSAVVVYERRLELTRGLYASVDLALATALTDLAHALRARGDYDAAERYGREAVDLLRRIVRADADSERMILADGISNLAQIYHFQGKLPPADSLFRESLGMRRALHGDVHPRVSESLNNLATVLHDEGKLDAAEAMYRDALAVDERVYGPEHTNVSATLVNLGRVLRDRRDLPGAEAAIRRSVDIDRKLSGAQHWAVGYGLNQLGGLRFDQSDFPGAERLYREALAVYDRSLSADNAYRVAPLLGVGNALIRQGRAAQAEAPLRRALQIARAALPPEHWLIGQAESHLGGCLMRLGRLAEAETLVVDGYERMRAALNETDARTKTAGERVSELRAALGREPAGSIPRGG
jgi:serine/threonine-protein kinase